MNGHLRTRALVPLMAATLLTACPWDDPNSDPVGPTEPSSPAPTSVAGYYRTQSISEFTILKGNQSNYARARARIEDASWAISDDGRFGFAPTDVRTDLFPLIVSYQRSGSTLSFGGYELVRVGTSGNSAFAHIEGTVTFSNGRPAVDMLWTNGAFYGAVVNRQTFQNNADTQYRVRVVLARTGNL